MTFGKAVSGFGEDAERGKQVLETMFSELLKKKIGLLKQQHYISINE